MLTIWRSNPTNILFENESDAKRRLTLDLGTTTIVYEETEEEVEVPNLICTPLVEEGGAHILTVTVGIPSFAFDDGYSMSVPGVDGPEIEVIVP